ncbi:uncharacterized protein LOC110684772 [Chenopodium quinoa]|uniref:uncharacterized protein LOC110684772 n=1 Tax=Chenopodium quinoa TaxID=63459 RepID=UPI000B775E97|nr:uncharacterized protein LOC110684772 [Chenopodium quinoa]
MSQIACNLTMCFYVTNENQSSKRKKVEKPKSKNVQPTKNMEQGQGLNKSLRGSAKSCTPIVEARILNSLSKACTFLHNRVSELLRGRSIEVILPKALFHYDEDGIAPITKEDVKEFLSGAMLNISIIQAFMRAL